VSRAGQAFRPATVLVLVAAGAAAFLLLLYALGAGWDGRDERNGGAHAASNGLTGFAALASLLEARGYAVSLSRSAAALDNRSLLVVTPPQFADGEQLAELVANRRYTGPTLLILPKWIATPVPQDPRIESEQGWVILSQLQSPGWTGEIAGLADAKLAIGETSGWRGLGLAGGLPEPDTAQAVLAREPGAMAPLIRDSEGDMLAGWVQDGGYYPFLVEADGSSSAPEPGAGSGAGSDADAWPLVVVIEPDLANNYGMADRTRAQAMLALVDALMEDQTMPIVFDLTIPGLGRSSNLLTLAFEPPFLAATLCLLLAAVLVAWRAFCRFGSPQAEMPELAHGKAQLARNGAALVERTGRVHLLGGPYAALVAARLAGKLGIGEADPVARAAAIDRALARSGQGETAFTSSAESLRTARRPRDLLRAAAALKSTERMLHP